MRLTDIRLLVDDVAGCAAFYRDVLGLEQRLEAGGGIYIELDGGDFTLGIYRRDLMESVLGEQLSPGTDDVLIFRVDDVDATYRELSAKGVEFVTDPHDQEAWFLRVAHLRDPEGHLIELDSPLPTDHS